MEIVKLLNLSNESVDAEVIRYFELNNNSYFIYSLNEVDDQNNGQGYIKLYAVKITDSNGVKTSSNIADEAEWNSVKEHIKVIVRGNKEGNLESSDLNHSELNSLLITDARVFKLSSQLVELLKANKNIPAEVEIAPTIEPVTIEAPIIEPDVVLTPEINNQEVLTSEPIMQVSVENDINYENLYLEEKARVEQLTTELTKLNEQINNIKNILNM